MEVEKEEERKGGEKEKKEGRWEGGKECHLIQLTKLVPVSNDLRARSFLLEYFFTLFFL